MALTTGVVTRAQAVNQSGSHYQLVTRIALFGSTLTTREGSVGDVDLGLELRPRLDGDDGNRLFAAEMGSAPASFQHTYLWPEERLRRHLRARRPDISLHTMEEVVKHGYPHKVIYQFDPTTGLDFVDFPW
jgi:hypothetical protein